MVSAEKRCGLENITSSDALDQELLRSWYSISLEEVNHYISSVHALLETCLLWDRSFLNVQPQRYRIFESILINFNSHFCKPCDSFWDAVYMVYLKFEKINFELKCSELILNREIIVFLPNHEIIIPQKRAMNIVRPTKDFYS
jgi:hypothetical protein